MTTPAVMKVAKGYSVTGTIKRETEKAICMRIVTFTHEHKDIWFPFSQVSEIHHSPNGGEDILVVSAWIAERTVGEYLA